MRDGHAGYHPPHRADPSSFAPPAVAPRADAAMAPSMASMPFCPTAAMAPSMAAMRLSQHDAYASAHARQHAAAPGAGGGGSEQPAAAAAAAAAMGRSARPLLGRPDAPLTRCLGT